MTGIAGIIGARDVDAARHNVETMIACMRHSDKASVTVAVSPEEDACIATCALPGTLSSRVSGVLPDGRLLAFAGELFPGDPPLSAVSQASVWASLEDCNPQSIGKLNGLFSAALIDPKRNEVSLFNDRYGLERIYVYDSGRELYFASQAKALLAVVPELRNWDHDGVVDFLSFGTTLGQKTLFSNVSTMPGGSLWQFRNGRVTRKERYFVPSEWETEQRLGEGEFEQQFAETAKTIIPNYAKSDGALGLSLTGGLDSRMILATLPNQYDSLVAYTYAAEEGDTLDVRVAQQVAELLQLDHEVLRLSDSFVKDYAEYVDRSIYITDATITATGAHELYFTELALAISPVRLTGNFGSELLRSMAIDRRLELQADLLAPDFESAVKNAAGSDRGSENSLSDTAFTGIPQYLYGPLALVRSLMTFRTPYLDNALVKLTYAAPESSRASILPALNLIADGPEGLGSIPTDLGYSCDRRVATSILRRLLCQVTFKLDYWDKHGLPSSLSGIGLGRKIADGFGLLGWHKYLPYRRWFRHEFAEYLQDVVNSEECRVQPWWQQKEVERALDAHLKGHRNCIKELDAIVTLTAVQRQFM